MWVGGDSGDMVKYRLFHPKPVQVRHRGHFSKAIYLIKIAAVIKIFFHFKLCFFLKFWMGVLVSISFISKEKVPS